MVAVEGVELRAPAEGRFAEILTPDALQFVAALQREFGPTRDHLLQARRERQARLNAGERPDFLTETRAIREGDWRVAPAPVDLQDRRVEITGPTDRKMVINALNSGARVFMADFEDANSPTWENVIEGQANLIDAIEGTIEFANPDGRVYRLNSPSAGSGPFNLPSAGSGPFNLPSAGSGPFNDRVATLVVRPRGWHLDEKHLLVDGEPISGSLLDFGLYFFHNARRLLAKGSGPYFYLPKLESHLEARLWNDVFNYAENALSVPRGSVKATVLIETILAAFEMEEILYELREHSGGLNAGRWDYIFSMIKKFRTHPNGMLPDRAQITMTIPFMRAYTELLVRTCHRHGAHAIGGMAAFVPSRRDAQINEVALGKVREDKIREAGDGFDGTWVAHPDLVPTAMQVFDGVLGERPNQVERTREDVKVDAAELLDAHVPGGQVTDAGLRSNVSVTIQYLESWLRGVGAVALNNLMEDAATAEISRSQVWQWIRNGARLDDGRALTRELVQQIEAEELARIRASLGEQAYASGRFEEAAALFNQVALADDFVEFLTLPAYEHLP